MSLNVKLLRESFDLVAGAVAAPLAADTRRLGERARIIVR